MSRRKKYTAENLAPMFVEAAALRNKMLSAGFTDNGGAIHSAERIMDILGLCLNYEELSHRNHLKKHPKAQLSEGARLARQKGKPLLIEHVAPLRHLTQTAIEKITGLKAADAERRLLNFVRKHYRLVLLTPEETQRLNKSNRSKMNSKRLERVGIRIVANDPRFLRRIVTARRSLRAGRGVRLEDVPE
jgi:hypothetical protein